MARAKGFQGIVGVKKGATWGTAVVPAASDGVEVLSLVPDGGTDMIEDNQITGRVTKRESSPGNRNVTMVLRTGLRYEGVGRLIALMMGTAGVPATVDTSGRRHTFKIKDDLDGIFSTIAYESIKDTKVEELTSVKLNKLKLTGKTGERFELEVEGICRDWKDDSASNTTTTIDSITLPSNREFALFSQAALLMNAQSGGALAGGDAVYIEGFELSLERAMRAPFTTGGGDKCDEPTEDDGMFTVTGSFEFATLLTGTGGNATFLAEQMSLTRKKATLTLTSPNLAGAATEPFSHKLWLPNLQFGKAKVGIPSAGTQRWTQPFTAYHVTAAPTGFTSGYVDAVTWDNVNQDTADVLA